MIDEASSLQTLRATFPTLDAWGAELSRPYIPRPGGDLARDDEDWPPTPVSQVAVMGLGSARDHLHAVRVHLEARELFPYAQLTAIRGALVGAAQAVWVLAPDSRDVRTERARLVAVHMYAEHLKYLSLLSDLAAGADSGTREVAEHVRQRHAQLSAVRAEAGERAALNTTDIVKTAVSEAFGRTALATEGESIWRMSSGAAHGFMWALLGQPDTRLAGEEDARGLAPFIAAGGVARILNPYMCAYHLAKRGWALRDLRDA